MALLRRVASFMGTAISVLLVAAVAAVVGLTLSQRRSAQGIPEVAHHLVLTILSGSMAPAIATGDVVVERPVTPAQAEQLHPGQIVTYILAGKQFHGEPLMITHRIVGVLTITNQSTGTVQHMYTTKGDANNAVDPDLVPASHIVAVYQWRIPYAGYVAAFMRRPLGFAIFVVLPILYLVGGEFVRIWRLMEADERQGAAPPEPAGQALGVVGGGKAAE